MNPAKVIGLSGPLESGKDTVAGILKEYGYIQVSYGHYIRSDVLRGHLGIGVWVPDRVRHTLRMLKSRKYPDELVYAKPTTPEIRELLQWWGQWRFETDTSYWTRLLLGGILELPQGKGRIVVSDVRRPVEYYQVSGMKGENWKIERIADESNPFRLHITETALAHYRFDVEIDNNQDINRLEHSVKMCLKAYDKGAVDERYPF